MLRRLWAREAGGAARPPPGLQWMGAHPRAVIPEEGGPLTRRNRLPIYFWLAALGVVFLVFILMSFEYTSRSDFCASCHEIRPAVESWRTSTHSDVKCLKCHADPGTVGFIKRKVGGLREVFLHVTQGYEEPIQARFNVENCLLCHDDVLELPETTNTRFAHGPHIENFGFDCLDCHARVVHGPREGEVEVSFHEVCASCHQQQIRSQDGCSTCHK